MLPFIQFFLYSALCLSVLGISYYYWTYERKCRQWSQSNIPFIKPIFGFGHKEFMKSYKQSLTLSFDNIYKETEGKDLVGFFLSLSPVVMIRNVELAQKVVVKQFAYNNKPGFSSSEDDLLLQNTVPFITDYEHWKQVRAMLSPHFSYNRGADRKSLEVQEIVEEMMRHAAVLESSGTPVRIRDFINPYVFKCSMLPLHGIEMNKLHGIYFDFVESGYINVFRHFVISIFPRLQMFKCLRMFKEKNRESMKEAIRKVMEDRLRDDDFQDDFVDFLIAKLKESKPQIHQDYKTKNGESWIKEKDLEWLSGLALASLIGTNEAVASGIQFVFHLLSLQPEFQVKIKEEVDAVMVNHDENKFTYPVVQDLKFTEQCVLESFRFYVSFPVIRQCVEDHRITNTDYILNKGDRIVISSHSVHMDPKYYPNPEKFDPERFGGDNNKLSYSASYLPFGAGPRKCPGYQIGTKLTVVFVAAVIQKYKILPRSHKQRITPVDYDPLTTFASPKVPVIFDFQKWDV